MSHTIAMLSVHTSPLDSPGRTKDAGGMNVYIRALALELGRYGHTVDIFTRQTNIHTPYIVQLAPHVRVIHIQAGPQTPVHKNNLLPYMPSFAASVAAFARKELRTYDILHSHYWLSGIVAEHLARRWDIPHVTMFHTLARLKQLAIQTANAIPTHSANAILTHPVNDALHLGLRIPLCNELRSTQSAEQIGSFASDRMQGRLRSSSAQAVSKEGLANPDEQESQQRLAMEQTLIQSVDCIIAATADERTQMMRYCGVSASRIQVIPCGVDLELFVPYDRQLMRQRFGLDPQQPVLLFAGRLDPFKGPDILLRAAALMEQEAQIVIVGGALTDDRDLQNLRTLAADLGIKQRTLFLGAQPQDMLPLLYSAADVTVVPSYHESFGLVAVESLACGTPVVATRAGGLMTVVHNDENGYLVPRCPGFFAERLDAILRNPDIQARMHAAARPSVSKFSWEGVALSVSEVYDNLVSEPIVAEMLS